MKLYSPALVVLLGLVVVALVVGPHPGGGHGHKGHGGAPIGIGARH